MGFAEQFLQGLMAGRAEQERKKQQALAEGWHQQQADMQRKQFERQGILDQQGQARDILGLLQSQPMPREEMPAGQAGPAAPAPRPQISIPLLGGGAQQITPQYAEDVAAQQRAAEDAKRSGALDLYREQQKIADELSRVDLSQAPELAKQFNLPAGPVDPKLLETAKAAALLREQLAGRAQQAALARAAAEETRRAREEANANKPLSGEASKVFAIAQSMPASIERIRQAVKGNLRGFVGGVQTGIDTDMARVVDDLADKVGRIRSGGAINKDEAASFKAQLVRTMDALKNDPAGILAALDRIEEEARSIQSSIRPNEVPVRGRGEATAPVKKLTYNPATGQLE